MRRDNLKRFDSHYGDNKQMNNDTYALRRKVMNIVYEANNMIEGKLPRVQVRITEDGTGRQENALGVATVGRKEIWIADQSFKLSNNDLRHVVLHELCHALFGTRHSNSCPLMSPKLSYSVGIELQNDTFKKYAKKAGYKTK